MNVGPNCTRAIAVGLLVQAAIASQAMAGPKSKPGPKDTQAADVVTLRDGTKILGQVRDDSTRSELHLLVRRDWAKANVPEVAARWAEEEARETATAVAKRRERLEEWKRDRGPGDAGPDRVGDWIDGELERLRDVPRPSTLMAVSIRRAEARSIDRRGETAARALRLGWTIGLKDVETRPIEEVNDALAGRGLLADGEAPIPLDDMLPTPTEDEAAWRRRRAATEVAAEEALRFLVVGNTLVPESRPDRANLAVRANSFFSMSINDLIGLATTDPLSVMLREVATRGRSGAMVTRMVMAPDMGSVTVESTLYVLQPGSRWTKAGSRSATVRANDVGPGAVAAIAGDPQVQSLFKMVDGMGLGRLSDDMKRKGLTVGAMTRGALGLCRVAVNRDLAALTLPLDHRPTTADK